MAHIKISMCLHNSKAIQKRFLKKYVSYDDEYQFFYPGPRGLPLLDLY
jgi:hypothetical protein